jgi:hypothetical protein
MKKIAGVSLWIWGVGVLVLAGVMATVRWETKVDMEVSAKASRRTERKIEQKQRPVSHDRIWDEYLASIQDERRSANQDHENQEFQSEKTKSWEVRVSELANQTRTLGNDEWSDALRKFRVALTLEQIKLQRTKNEVRIRAMDAKGRAAVHVSRPRIVRNEELEGLSDQQLSKILDERQREFDEKLTMSLDAAVAYGKHVSY